MCRITKNRIQIDGKLITTYGLINCANQKYHGVHKHPKILLPTHMPILFQVQPLLPYPLDYCNKPQVVRPFFVHKN